MLLLVHSCDSREWLCEHWLKFFFQNADVNVNVEIITGEKEWTDQLIEALERVEDEYIIHTLDDYWIVQAFDFKRYFDLCIEMKADVLRLQPNVHFDSLPYRFEKAGELFRQTRESAYKNSTHFSIYRREYLLSTLKPGMNVWSYELSEPENFGEIYFVPHLPFWYIDGTIHGEMTEGAKKLINDGHKSDC